MNKFKGSNVNAEIISLPDLFERDVIAVLEAVAFVVMCVNLRSTKVQLLQDKLERPLDLRSNTQ